MKTLANKIASFANDLSYRSLPKDVVNESKVRIIDSIACAFGAYESDTSKIARAVCGVSGTGATILGHKTQTHPLFATFANGVMIRYLDFNDTYLSLEPAHPSDNIGACLAAAESRNRSGKDLITAIVLAYEIQCRLCDTACLRSRGWDHTTYGSISTAAAVAKLLKGDVAQAVNIAGSSNIALRQIRIGELSHWKGCAFAHAAMNGYFAAELAANGMTGPAPIFEGPMGFEKQVSGSLAKFRFGKKLKLAETYLKFYPAEYHAQASIEAALKLRPQIRSKIESVEIEIYDAAIEIIGDKSKWRPVLSIEGLLLSEMSNT